MPDQPAEKKPDFSKFQTLEAISQLRTLDASERSRLLAKNKQSLAGLEEKYGAHYDSRMLQEPGAMLYSAESPPPYCFIWMPDGERKAALDTTQRIHSQYFYQGWSPTNVAEIESICVFGDDALLLGIPRNLSYRQIRASQNVERKKKGLPEIKVPDLPERLKGKIGFIVPPYVDANGFAWNSADYRLWSIPRDQMEDIEARTSIKHNGLLTPPDSMIKNESYFGGFATVNSPEMMDFINDKR